MAHVSRPRSPADIERLPRGSTSSKSLLRFITCGSVDDGKSTLIGRLLYDSQDAVRGPARGARGRLARRSGTQGGELDFALLVDGLAAEREQGITIDVAYRFFSTDKRKFIVADTPGHEQYTRNMVTGASTADLAVILIDARKGVLTQTRRHSYLVSLLGIRHVVLAVNKMDLVDYSRRRRSTTIVDEYREFAEQIGLDGRRRASRCPALHGRQHRRRRARTCPGTRGPTLMRLPRDRRGRRASACSDGRSACRCSGSTGPTSISAASPARSPAAAVEPGRPRPRAALRPREHASRASSRQTAICRSAVAGKSVTLTLADEIDVSPRRRASPRPTRRRRSPTSSRPRIVWMDDEPMLPGRAVPAEDRHAAPSRRRSRALEVQGQRQHAGAPRGEDAGAERDRRLQPRSSTGRSPSIPTRRTATPAASS